MIPQEMRSWNMYLVEPYPTDEGKYELVECTQADIEMHHQVEVIDENGFPLRGIWVIFGFDSGPDINLSPVENHWINPPRNLKGNAQKTNGAGYAEHTFGEGGENIWVWDIESDGILRLPSPIVENCTWQTPPIGRFNHTGVKLVFQRKRKGVVPFSDKVKNLENRIASIEDFLGNEI